MNMIDLLKLNVEKALQSGEMSAEAQKKLQSEWKQVEKIIKPQS